MKKIEKRTQVQTLIFSKGKFTREQAVKWATDHDFRSDKVDEDDSSFRLRQKEPDDFVDGSFKTIDITTGVKAVIATPKQAAKSVDDSFWSGVI